MPFPEDDSREYILLGGHHQALAYHNVGRITVPGLIYETDEELLAAGFARAQETRRLYQEVWEPRMAWKGIRGVQDLQLIPRQTKTFNLAG